MTDDQFSQLMNSLSALQFIAIAVGVGVGFLIGITLWIVVQLAKNSSKLWGLLALALVLGLADQVKADTGTTGPDYHYEIGFASGPGATPSLIPGGFYVEFPEVANPIATVNGDDYQINESALTITRYVGGKAAWTASGQTTPTYTVGMGATQFTASGVGLTGWNGTGSTGYDRLFIGGGGSAGTPAGGTQISSGIWLFGYRYHLQPVVTSINPASGDVTGGTNVVITGTYLAGTQSVKFDGVPATSFTVVNDTTIHAVSPAHPTSGLINVVGLTNHSPALFWTIGYTYTVQVPTVTILQNTELTRDSDGTGGLANHTALALLVSNGASLSGTITVNYLITRSPSNADEGTDYTSDPPNGYPSGNGSITCAVPVLPATSATTFMATIHTLLRTAPVGTITVTLQNASAGEYIVGDPHQATITLDAKAPPAWHVSVFASLPDAYVQTDTPGEFTFTRTDTSLAETFNFTVAGSAQEGVNYFKIQRQVEFGVGVDTQKVQVNPLYDPNQTTDLTVIATLDPNSLPQYYSIESPGSATVTIHPGGAPTTSGPAPPTSEPDPPPPTSQPGNPPAPGPPDPGSPPTGGGAPSCQQAVRDAVMAKLIHIAPNYGSDIEPVTWTVTIGGTDHTVTWDFGFVQDYPWKANFIAGRALVRGFLIAILLIYYAFAYLSSLKDLV